MRQKQVQIEADFDDLMASLFVLVTHHSLAQCKETVPVIVQRLEQLACHSELELYPHQRKVIAKMQQLWRAQLYKEAAGRVLH